MPLQGVAAPAPGSSASAHVPGASTGHSDWTPPASPRRAMASLIALAAAAFMVVTNEIAPQGLIRLMAADLGRTESELGLVTTVFALTVMVATLPLALLTTRLPRRPVIVGTLVFWSAGALVVATSDTFAQLLAGRVMTAMGHALFWAVVTPAAAGLFAPQVRGRSVTRLMLGGAAAGVFGLPASTWLGQQTDWRLPFMIVGIGSLILAVAIALIMPRVRNSERSSTRGDVPSLRRFIRVLVVVVFTTTSMAITWTYITPFFVEVSGFAEESVPLLLMLGGAVGVVAMWLTGRFLDRWPVRSMVVGEAAMLVMWLGLASLGQYKVAAIGMIVIQGIAWSLLVAAMLNWSLRHTPWRSDIGVGAQASVFNAGFAAGSVIGGSMLAAWGAQWLPLASAACIAVALTLVVSAAPDAIKALSQKSGRSSQRRLS